MRTLSKPKGRSLELYFIDGRPDGMLTAEVFNWTGHVLMAPRTQIAEALKRDEAGYTGVYLLLGEKDGYSHGYVGEGENIAARIRQHESGKDWWDLAVIITSTANQLNKAHVKYLEARLIQEARAVGRLGLENVVDPQPTGLSEADTANMEIFLDYVLLVLPALRIDYFLRQTRPAPDEPVEAYHRKLLPIFVLRLPKYGIRATAELINGEFVVLQGSLARKEWSQTTKHSYSALHATLVNAGVLVESGEHRKFAENYAFRSPSAAAAIVTGRTANGRREWRIKDSIEKTYGDWEIGQLTQVEEARQ